MTAAASEPIAVIGVGTMGHGMAVSAPRPGNPTVVWARTPHATRELAELGADVAAALIAASRNITGSLLLGHAVKVGIPLDQQPTLADVPATIPATVRVLRGSGTVDTINVTIQVGRKGFTFACG